MQTTSNLSLFLLLRYSFTLLYCTIYSPAAQTGRFAAVLFPRVDKNGLTTTSGRKASRGFPSKPAVFRKLKPNLRPGCVPQAGAWGGVNRRCWNLGGLVVLPRSDGRDPIRSASCGELREGDANNGCNSLEPTNKVIARQACVSLLDMPQWAKKGQNPSLQNACKNAILHTFVSNEYLQFYIR